MNSKMLISPWRARAKNAALLFLAVVLPLASHAAGSAAESERGFTYRRDIVPDVPWSIHILQIDRSNTNLELHTTIAKGSVFGLATLGEHVKHIPAELGKPVAAVNGDYYRNDKTGYLGDPKGLQIMQGELVSAPCDWSCFWIDAAGNPHLTNVTSHFAVTWPNGATTPFGLNEERLSGMAVLYTSRVGRTTGTRGGRELVLETAGSSPRLPLRAGETYTVRVREVRRDGNTPLRPDRMVLSLSNELLDSVPQVKSGAVLTLSLATSPGLKGVKTALGGGPSLIQGGKVKEWDLGLLAIRERMRHPRTAIGWNDKYIYLVEVDGRQPSLSVGMTYAEIADYMARLGCTEALNLDGGGSATIWIYGQIANSPSKGYERGMANALVLVQKQEGSSAE